MITKRVLLKWFLIFCCNLELCNTYCVAESTISTITYAPNNWLVLPGGMYLNNDAITTDMKILVKGQALDISVDVSNSDSKSIPDSPLKCCTEFLISILSRDFNRYATLTAPKEERNPDGTVHADYSPAPGPIGWKFLNRYIEPGWAKIHRYIRLGDVHCFEFTASSSATPLKATGGSMWVQEVMPGIFRNATFEYITQTQENVANWWMSPENPLLALSKTQGRIKEFRDGIDGSTLKEHEITLTNLYGDVKGEYPVRIQFRGGPLKIGGPYENLRKSYLELRKVFEKIPDEKPFDGPEWQACMELIDEYSKNILQKQREDAQKNPEALTAFLSNLRANFGSDIVYVIDMGPLYLCFVDTPKSHSDINFWVKFLKTPNGYKLTQHFESASFDSNFRYKPFWDQLLVIMTKEIEEIK
jgi:hypothetical protein